MPLQGGAGGGGGGGGGAGGWPVVSGSYYISPQFNSFTFGTITLGLLGFLPYLCPAGGMTIDTIGCYVQSGIASGKVRLGIYQDAGGYPGSLIVDAGQVDASTSGFKEITITQAVSGIIWLSGVCQTAQAQVGEVIQTPRWVGTTGGTNPSQGINATGVTGALPDPAASLTFSSSRVVLVYIKAA